MLLRKHREISLIVVANKKLAFMRKKCVTEKVNFDWLSNL